MSQNALDSTVTDTPSPAVLPTKSSKRIAAHLERILNRLSSQFEEQLARGPAIEGERFRNLHEIYEDAYEQATFYLSSMEKRLAKMADYPEVAFNRDLVQNLQSQIRSTGMLNNRCIRETLALVLKEGRKD